MHTHLFTARYLPLHGVLRSFGVPNLLARGLARIAFSITGVSDFGAADDENQDDLVEALLGRDADKLMRVTTGRTRTLIRRYQSFAERSPDEEEALQEALGGIDDIATELGEAGIDRPPMSSRILHVEPLAEKSVFGDDVDIPDELDSLLARSFSVAGQRVSGSPFFHEAVHLHLDEDFDPGTDRGLKAAGLSPTQVRGLRQVLLFIGVMALSERNRYRVLEKDYAKGKPADGVDATHYVGVLMDMQEAYAELWGRNLKRPHFDFKTQMRRMNALAQETDGKLISYGAVDPFRSKDWKSYVEHGVAHGAKGFKIYCPLGYRPIDDRSYVTPVGPGAPPVYADRAEEAAPAPHAQAAMAEILPYFAQRGLRMFTHCTPVGFSAKEGYGIYADPELWRRAMERYAARDLWLFLGHGGGATEIDWYGWAAASDEDFEKSFAYRVIQLAQDYDNVYLGLGYILDVLDPNRRCRVFDRLKHYLTAPKPDGARRHFKEKVCYGTDWSMPQAIGRTRAYLNAFYEFFDDEEIRDWAPAFFEGNAKKYLGLAPAG
ncbi:hypothetical protein D1F64_06375 [Breoghania sp. L-A4]|nr:hypothetical protein D1F64_06375 [Breoghania sp. L-A4]